MTAKITPFLLSGDAPDRIGTSVSKSEVHAAIAAALQHTLLQVFEWNGPRAHIAAAAAEVKGVAGLVFNALDL